MLNPQLGTMLRNPQMRSMLSSPEFIQSLSNPAVMQVRRDDVMHACTTPSSSSQSLSVILSTPHV